MLVGPAGVAAPPQVIVVHDDRGGAVEERARQVAAYRAAGVRVEVRDGICMSACTMYLALDTLCVGPRAVFGFHGPSSPHYGIALAPDAFEHASQLMARHYPPALRDWFLREGRHRIVGFHRVSGAELIDMGVPACV